MVRRILQSLSLILTLFGLMTLLVFSGCDKLQQSSNQKHIKQTKSGGNLDAQALEMVEITLNRVLPKCGDSWFSIEKIHSNETLIEHKGLTLTIKPWPVNEADKLNGLEWQGEVQGSESRRFNHGQGWNEWYTSYISVYAEKRNAGWTVKPRESWVNITCDDIARFR